jgi:hypothetical protein
VAEALQHPKAAQFFVGISLINMVLYFINLYFFNSFTIIGLQPGTVDNSAYFDLINSQKEKIDAVFAVTYLFEIIVLMIFSYIFSHRIAGSIHRLKISNGYCARRKCS